MKHKGEGLTSAGVPVVFVLVASRALLELRLRFPRSSTFVKSQLWRQNNSLRMSKKTGNGLSSGTLSLKFMQRRAPAAAFEATTATADSVPSMSSAEWVIPGRQHVSGKSENEFGFLSLLGSYVS